MTIKILELFAGVSGISFGFELLRDREGNKIFELHRAVEIEKYACETLRRNYSSGKVIEGDLTDKNIHEKVIKECKGKVSIVVGGIPCQSFSLIGPRSGYGKNNEKFMEDERDNLYVEFRDITKEIRPNIVVIENVRGILSKKDKSGKRVIDRIISDFEGIGYNFKNNKDGEKYMLLNAAEYGVPQNRHRVILIGIHKEWKKIDVPFIEPTHFNPEAKNSAELGEKGLLPYVTLYSAIGDLPELQPKMTFTDLTEKEKSGIRKLNCERNNGQERILFDEERFNNHLEAISESGKLFLDFIRPNGYQWVDHHIARSHQLSDLELYGCLKEGETAKDFMLRKPDVGKKLIKYNMDSFKDKYRRQRWDQPCTTVFAHLEKDGNRFIHPGQARTFTPREAARIQSFPDYFVFDGPLSKKFRQIGNAVPPLMALKIADKINEICTMI